MILWARAVASVACPLFDMQLDHLAEMKAVDGKRDCQGKEAWAAEQGPEEEPPVVRPFYSADPELVNGPQKCQDILRFQWSPDFRTADTTRRNVCTRS